MAGRHWRQWWHVREWGCGGCEGCSHGQSDLEVDPINRVNKIELGKEIGCSGT